MTTPEVVLHREHMHGAALAFRIATRAASEFGHHAFGIHIASQHVAMIAVGGDDGIFTGDAHFKASDDRFLTDV